MRAASAGADALDTGELVHAGVHDLVDVAEACMSAMRFCLPTPSISSSTEARLRLECRLRK